MKRCIKALVVILVLAVVAVCVVGCDMDCDNKDIAANQDSRFLNAQQDTLTKAVPPPSIQFSVERQNISDRAEIFSNPEKLGYIYLISYGKVMAFYPIKGKATSLRSYMVSQEQVYRSSQGNVALPAPDIDGSYGDNADGIFFFTPEGVYIEWLGEYMYADAPLKMATPPEIIYTAPLD